MALFMIGQRVALETWRQIRLFFHERRQGLGANHVVDSWTGQFVPGPVHQLLPTGLLGEPGIGLDQGLPTGTVEVAGGAAFATTGAVSLALTASDAVSAFLRKVESLPVQVRPASGRRARLLFAVDATASRQPSWDRACHLQGEMFMATKDLGGLGVPGELALVRKLAEWPRLVEIAAGTHEPHRIAFYLYELASEFHALQHQGKLEPSLRFIREDAPALTRARLALVRATQVVVKAGLGILGVTPMDEMR